MSEKAIFRKQKKTKCPPQHSLKASSVRSRWVNTIDQSLTSSSRAASLNALLAPSSITSGSWGEQLERFARSLLTVAPRWLSGGEACGGVWAA